MNISESILLDIPEREFSYNRQQICDYLYQYNKTFNPDIVIGPTYTDYHQDHQTVSWEIIRAFKSPTILQYMSFRSIEHNNYNYFVELPDDILKKKIELMNVFESQLSIKPYNEYVLTTMKQYGMMLGKEMVEPFVAYRIKD